MFSFPDKIEINEVTVTSELGKSCLFSIARLDQLHSVVSGNKIFKLKYNLQEAVSQKKKGIITMGGAYSNHVAATAFACREAGLKSAAFIRGEIITPFNHTLNFCKECGMELLEIPRSHFHRNDELILSIRNQYPDYFFIPEGGDNVYGQKGCAELMSLIQNASSYTHIVTAIGTGTTLKGLATSIKSHQTVIGIPVLKIKAEEQAGFTEQMLEVSSKGIVKIVYDFAGNGYGKKDKALFSWMNRFYTETLVPTDFIYTAKVMKAITVLFDTNIIEPDSKVLVLHTGGLQGNASLDASTLIF